MLTSQVSQYSLRDVHSRLYVYGMVIKSNRPAYLFISLYCTVLIPNLKTFLSIANSGDCFFYGGTMRSCAGENPLLSADLYSKVVPIALYGSELWSNKTATELNTISRFQHYVV